MEPKFQTSFIPKKPTTVGGGAHPLSHHRGTSLFMALEVLLFIASLALTGGAYAWKAILISSQDSFKKDLAAREQQFNLDLISQLKEANIKVDTAKQLLANHLAMSEIFGLIGKLTIQDVRFMTLDVEAPPTVGGDVSVKLSGLGTSFSAVAFQSDVLNQLEQYGLRKIVINPILSDPQLAENGTVSFGFTASIDPTAISYEQSVAPTTAPTTASTPVTTPTATSTTTP